MFLEHGDIFMHKLLKQKLHKLSADQIKLSPEKQKSSANANRLSLHTSKELSQGKLDKTYETPAQGAILKVPFSQLSIKIADKSKLLKIHKQQKSINWLQSNLNPDRLLETTITDIKHHDTKIHFYLHGLPRMKNPYQFGPFICIRPIRLQKRST